MAEVKKNSSRTELGVSAVSLGGGIVQEREYNADLKGKKKFEVFEKMSDGDGTVQAILSAMNQPILQASWTIEPASERRDDQKVASFIEDNLFSGMTRSWKQTLEEILNYLIFGVMPFELVFDLDEEKRFYLRKLSVRHPKTIQKWALEDGSEGIVQWTGRGRVEIPLWKLALFVHKRLGDSWEGKSVLRPGYKHWHLKDKYYLVDAIATERQGLGIPIGKVPPGTSDDEKKKFEKILANMRTNEKPAVVMEDGWMVELLDMKGHTLKDPEKMINHHNRELAKMVLAQFLEIGVQNNAGGYAQSRNETEFFTMALNSIAQYISETFNQYVIRKIVDLNFQVESYPELKYDKIGQPNLEPWAKAIAELVNIKALTPDHNVETYIREVLDLPEIGAVPVSDELIDAIVADIHEVTTPQQQPLFASAKSTKQKLVDLEQAMRKELLEMQAKGVEVTREEIAEFKLKYHDRKARLLRDMATVETEVESSSPMDDQLLAILEEVDDVRSSLQT